MDKVIKTRWLPANVYFLPQCNEKEEIVGYKISFNGAGFPSIKSIELMVLSILEVEKEMKKKGQKELDTINDEIEKSREEELNKPLETRKNNNSYEGFVYFLKSLNLYKIGRAKNEKRIESYRTENPHGIELIKMVKVDDCVATESYLLEKYFSKNHRGEWFIFDESDIKEITIYLDSVKI